MNYRQAVIITVLIFIKSTIIVIVVVSMDMAVAYGLNAVCFWSLHLVLTHVRL